ncbi:replication initiation protein [Holzapfeliella sp. He02]|uniref:Replication initiation protein n=1 Tax=Holzapfeliella saturejae TaxID=3082953 RepID=A0ABU8SHH7_9LACO
MAVNEITRYDIELNTIPLGKLKAPEMNLFFSIITKMKDQKSNVVRFYLNDLKELAEYKVKGHQRFLKLIRDTYSKLLTLNFGYKSKTGTREEHFVLFTKFVIDQDEEKQDYVDIQIFEDAIPLLNDLDQWVRYSLHEFNSLKSTYAKTLFRLLKQYRTTGFFKINKKEFNELMAIPEKYQQFDINRRILKPSMEQLSPFFENLKLEKHFAKKQGRPLIGYTFTFKPEERNSDDFQDRYSYKKRQEEVKKVDEDPFGMDDLDRFNLKADDLPF